MFNIQHTLPKLGYHPVRISPLQPMAWYPDIVAPAFLTASGVNHDPMENLILVYVPLGASRF